MNNPPTLTLCLSLFHLIRCYSASLFWATAWTQFQNKRWRFFTTCGAWDESRGWADPSLQTITRPGSHWVTTNIHSHNSMVWLHVSACLSLYFQHLSTFLSLPSGPSSAWESHPTVDAKISQARPRRRNDPNRGHCSTAPMPSTKPGMGADSQCEKQSQGL